MIDWKRRIADVLGPLHKAGHNEWPSKVTKRPPPPPPPPTRVIVEHPFPFGGADDWQPMDSAPKDGTEVYLQLEFKHGIPAYWDNDLKTWVLSRPLHMESMRQPDGWRPKWHS